MFAKKKKGKWIRVFKKIIRSGFLDKELQG